MCVCACVRVCVRARVIKQQRPCLSDLALWHSIQNLEKIMVAQPNREVFHMRVNHDFPVGGQLNHGRKHRISHYDCIQWGVFADKCPTSKPYMQCTAKAASTHRTGTRLAVRHIVRLDCRQRVTLSQLFTSV